MMHNTIVCSYSRVIAHWLINKFPGDVSLDNSRAGNEEIIGVLQLLLPAVEFQACTQGSFNLSGRIKQLSGLKTKKEQLVWLLDLFEHSKLPEPVKDELYGHLKLFVKWKSDQANIEKNYLHLPVKKLWEDDKRISSFDALRITRKKIGSPIPLPVDEKAYLIDAMKISLSLYYRETDPVTFADINELELFDMGRGLSIALIGMQKQRRLSLENYIGYMAFKNGVPLAYGGGWIWGHRCRIGISIYPDHRKGESAWLFSQVLRLYFQYYNARHFIIRANQFGQGNRDGIKSGAFWFYYKLGFRPCHDEIKILAGEEWKKIRENKNYRSSPKTLQMFTAGPLEWKLDKESFPGLDAEEISRKITDMINKYYGGSRVKALRLIGIQLKNKLKPLTGPKQVNTIKPYFENWCLLLNLLPGLQDWKLKDKNRLLELIREKHAGKERDYILGMQEFLVFWEELKKLSVEKE